MKADVTFEAENIDEALAHLAIHFDRLCSFGVDFESSFTGGEITIEPMQ